MKNVLLLVHDDVGQESRLQVALDITRALRGHLTCLDGTVYPAMAEGSSSQQERARAALHGDRIADRLREEDVSWSMSAMPGDLADGLIAASGLADLIVINRQLDGAGPDMPAIAGTVAIKSGKPVVAVPEQCRMFDINGHAVVAWDGSAQAMAALTRSVPLLALARSVSILDVLGDRSNGSVDQAATYLSRHDIGAEIDRVARSKVLDASVSETIQMVCANQHASWCVMGAYGQSRAREAVFGGVTRDMLSESTIPLVLAH